MAARAHSRKPRRSASGSKPASGQALGDCAFSRLENGLELLCKTDRSHPLVSVQVWIRAGSLQEGDLLGSGIAHGVEHMLFKGTSKRPAKAIATEVQRLGGVINAYTSWNRTVYWIDGLAQHAGRYLEILADMVLHSKFEAGEFKREQEVIRREMAMDADDPDSQLQQLVLQSCLGRHPLSLPILGEREVFDRLARRDLLQFVGRHYRPNNAFVVVTGDLGHDQAEAMVRQHLGSWSRGATPTTAPAEICAPKGQLRRHRDFASELLRLTLAWQVPGGDSPDKPALDVLAFVLGGGRSSRLHQQLCENLGCAHSAWAGCWGAADVAIFQLETQSQPDQATVCEEALTAQLKTLQRKGPTRSELTKAVASATAAQLRSLATTRGQATAIGSSWMSSGHWNRAEQYLRELEALTPAKVAEVARRLLSWDQCKILSLGPSLPQGRASDKPTHAVSLDQVVAKRLPNGMGVQVLRDARLPLISLRLSLLASLPVESDSQVGATTLLAAWMLQGTKRRSASQIAARLEDQGGRLYCHADVHRLVLGADVIAAQLPQALELIADLLLNADLPEEAEARIKGRHLAQIQEEAEDPVMVALRAARAAVLADTCYAQTAMGSLAGIKALKRSDLLDLRRQIAKGSNAELAVVGDVDAAEVFNQVALRFAAVPKGQRPPAMIIRRAPDSVSSIQLKRPKEQAVAVLAFRTVGLEHQDLAALLILEEALSDMGSRLFQRIRERLGLAYSVGAQHFAAMGAGAFYFYLMTSKSQLPLAARELRQIIASVGQMGIKAAELEQARQAWLAQWERSRQSLGAWAESLSWAEVSGQGREGITRLVEEVRALTLREVNRCAKRYLGSKSGVAVQVVPEREIQGSRARVVA